MNQPSSFPEFKSIETSGTYIVKVSTPKEDKIERHYKKNAKGFASARIYFSTGDNKTGSVYLNTEWGKSLAIFVGKFSGTFAKDPSPEMSVEQLVKYVSPAWGQRAEVELEVTPNGEYNGQKQFKYKFKKITRLDGQQSTFKASGHSDDYPVTNPPPAAAPEFDAPF
jgi:hypothetical protein